MSQTYIIKLGDYFVSKDKEVYRITNISYATGGRAFYDLRATRITSSNFDFDVTNSVPIVDAMLYKTPKRISGIALEDLLDQGTIIPQEDSDILDILYGDSDKI